MSDTPRTDAAAYWLELCEVVAIEFCRQLERENAEIKVRCESLRQSHDRQIAALERENAALRTELAMWRDGNIIREEDRNELIQLRADKERLDWLGSVKCAYFHEGPCCWRINEDETTDAETIRAAIDAARKEQP